MALIVEDGTMPPGANCYVDVAFVDAVAVNVNDTSWASLSNADKERAIILGALIVDDGAVYRYSGNPQTATQFRVWPRNGAAYEAGGPAVPPSTIPSQIMNANAVAALGINSGSILPPGGSSAPPGRYVKSETVGDLSVSYGLMSDGSGSGGGATGPYAGLGYPSITAIVSPLLDEAFYTAQAATPGAGVSSAVAAARGPSMMAPSYGGLFDVGMHDNSSAQKIGSGIN